MIPLCVHCKRNMKTKPRGLCYACYKNPRIRRLYPSGQTERLQRLAALESHLRPASYPTFFLPGDPDKVTVLAARRARGEHLWHPRDAKPEDDAC